MREKKVLNSYLNPRLSTPDTQDDNGGVQTETLAPATVKISSNLAAYANPYSIITNEYVETKTVAASYIINPVELAKNEVKLPRVSEVVSTEVKQVDKIKLPEFETVEVAKPAPKMSDMEILNRLAEYQDVKRDTDVAETQFEIPKDAEIFNQPKEENLSNDLEILNELQADETEAKQSSTTKEKINTAMNGLEGLLAELSDEDGSNTLGMG